MALFGRPTERDEAKAAAYREWMQQREPLAIASFVLGIFSLIEFGALLIFGVAGTALGFLALSRLKRGGQGHTAGKMHGRRLAWAGIVTSLLSLAIAIKFVYGWV